MNTHPKNSTNIVEIAQAKADRLIPRDPVRAEAFEVACDQVAQECREAIQRGEDALPHKELLALINGDSQTATRMRDLEDRRQRMGLRRVT